MEGVGARLGRSSSRYGTTTVFSGPVRKWKKDWVPVTPPNTNSNNNNNQNQNSNSNNNHQQQQQQQQQLNGNAAPPNNGGSHLRLFKWTPVRNNNNNNKKENSNNGKVSGGLSSIGETDVDGDSPSNNKVNDVIINKDGDVDGGDEDDVTHHEQPPRRKKFKYIPIALLEEPKNEIEDISEDEAKAADTEENTAEQALKSDSLDEKPDINDVPMEENQDSEDDQTAPGRQDLNESLDLSLGLTSGEGEHDSDSKADGQLPVVDTE